MADEDRAPSHPVDELSARRAEALQRAGRRAARVRLFSGRCAAYDAVNPDKPRLGESLKLVDSVRLGQIPSVIFAPSRRWAEFHPRRKAVLAPAAVLFLRPVRAVRRAAHPL